MGLLYLLRKRITYLNVKSLAEIFPGGGRSTRSLYANPGGMRVEISIKNRRAGLVGYSRPTGPQKRWLKAGLSAPKGRLPLFDRTGQRIPDRTMQACINQKWAEPWFSSPLKSDWRICKLTSLGRHIISE